MTCVCGHPPADHRAVRMSEPLLRRAPALYALPTPCGIATAHPRATYDRDECWCGCCEYLEDHDAAAVG